MADPDVLLCSVFLLCCADGESEEKGPRSHGPEGRTVPSQQMQPSGPGHGENGEDTQGGTREGDWRRERETGGERGNEREREGERERERGIRGM